MDSGSRSLKMLNILGVHIMNSSNLSTATSSHESIERDKENNSHKESIDDTWKYEVLENVDKKENYLKMNNYEIFKESARKSYLHCNEYIYTKETSKNLKKTGLTVYYMCMNRKCGLKAKMIFTKTEKEEFLVSDRGHIEHFPQLKMEQNNFKKYLNDMDIAVPFDERYRRAAEKFPHVAQFWDKTSQKSSNSRTKLRRIPPIPSDFNDFLNKIRESKGSAYEMFTHYKDGRKFVHEVICDTAKQNKKFIPTRAIIFADLNIVRDMIDDINHFVMIDATFKV
jgi:hypothetical protein